jgi:hypothetical protein
MSISAPTIPLILMTCLIGRLPAAEPGDSWTQDQALYPATAPPRAANPAAFDSLKAEVIIGRLNVFWRADKLPETTAATLHYSADHPGHWPAREWHKIPMRLRQNLFDAKVPVSDIDVPIIYFVAVEAGSERISSPARIVRPREADMEKPSSVFWPFIEGFENGTANWSVPAGTLSNDARSGGQALGITLAAGKNSASISTTRVRGWHFLNQRARAIRVWLKSSRQGSAKFSLTSYAHTEAQTVATSRITAKISSEWQAVDLTLDSFGTTTPAGIDLFTIEFVGQGPVDFSVDDIQYLGRWRVKGL